MSRFRSGLSCDSVVGSWHPGGVPHGVILRMSSLCCASLQMTRCAVPPSGDIDLTTAIVHAREGGAAEAEKTAVAVLIEEAEKRTGVRWARSVAWPESGAVVVATSKLDGDADGTGRAGRGSRGRGAIEAGGFHDRHRRRQTQAAGRLDRRRRPCLTRLFERDATPP